MASKRLPAPPTPFPDPDELEELFAADEACFLKELAAFRERNFRGRFTELDYALNLKSGGVARIFKGERTLDHRRLLRMIRLSGEDPERFFSRAFPSRYRQWSPVGLLPRLVERDPRISPPAWRDRLLAWAETVEISSDGRSFDFDPEELLRIQREDITAAQRAGIAAIDFFVSVSGGTLATCSVIGMAKWIAILAAMLRSSGDRYSSAEVFDLSFQLEALVDDDRCRAFIYRNSSYLLSDWGELEGALCFAKKAIEAASLGGDFPGLGLSHYAHATISMHLGDPDYALREYRACLAFFEESQSESTIATLQITALLELDRGNKEEAKRLIAELDRSIGSSVSAKTCAHVELSRGELASHEALLDRAERHFDAASKIFDEIGDISNLALVGLFSLRHRLRHGQYSRVSTMTGSLLALGNDHRMDKMGRAILWEIARQCSRGEARIDYINKQIGEWRKISTRRLTSRGCSS